MTTGAVDSLFIDTNVLVYATLVHSPFHLMAQQRLNTYNLAGAELWVSRQILREYLSALSRLQGLSLPIPVTTLVAEVELFQRQYSVAEDSSDVTQGLLDLISKISIGGKQVHDANIVATMRVYVLPIS